MSSARCGDSSSTDYSGHRSTHSRNKGQSHKSSCHRRHTRSRSRSPHRGDFKRSHNRSRSRSRSPRHRHRTSHNSQSHKPSSHRRHTRSRSRSRHQGDYKRSRSRNRIRSQSPRHSHRSCPNSRRRSSGSHHAKHSGYRSPSRGRHINYSQGGSWRSTDRSEPYSRSQAGSNRNSSQREPWGASNSTTTGKWSHDGYLQTYANYPTTNAVPVLTLEEGYKLFGQGSHCSGCAQAPAAEVVPECTAGNQAPLPSLPPRPITACNCSESVTTKRWCDVDTIYDPPRFRTAADLNPVRLPRPPPQPHMHFHGMHRTYGGCDVMVAITPPDVAVCVPLLELSMADDVVAMDLEWKANTDSNQDNRVALIQLASSSMVLLIKTTGLDFLPGPLETFLRKKGRTFLGLGWGSSDEQQMRKSFNFVRDDFSRFIDLQAVLAELGYPNNQVSVPSIAFNCFGLAVDIMDNQEMRNGWDTPILSERQIVYAARDALITAYAYRQLRAWHDAAVNPTLQTRICEACGRAFGVPTEWQMGPTAIRCLEAHCRKTFSTVQALADHASSTKHAASHVQCHSCNRLCCIE